MLCMLLLDKNQIDVGVMWPELLLPPQSLFSNNSTSRSVPLFYSSCIIAIFFNHGSAVKALAS